MIKKGDLILFKIGTEDEDVGLVVRVSTVRRETAYLVDNGYEEEMVSPRQVLQVLKALPSRKRMFSVAVAGSKEDGASA